MQNRVCAVPLTHVIETMRQLPIEPLAGVPAFVRGACIIRGKATPVVDCCAIMGMRSFDEDRFVTIRVGEKQVALSVGAVLGVREIESSSAAGVSRLLQGVSNDLIETIGTLDGEFLMVLRSCWKLPDAVWHALAEQEVAV